MQLPRVLLLIVVPIGILMAGAGSFAYLKATKPELVAQPQPEKEWTVSAIPVEISDVRPTLDVFGQIVAGRSVELRPLVSGQIIRVGDDYVEGGIVAVGDLIAEIDPFDFEAAVAEAEAQLREAESRISEYESDIAAESALLKTSQRMQTLRQRDVNRREELLGRGAGSVKTLDDARMALAEAQRDRIGRDQTISRTKARLAQQQATVDRLRVVVDRTKRDLRNTRLTAPFPGFLTETNAAIGQQVSVGDRLARLVDANRLEARFHLTDQDFERLLGTNTQVRGQNASVIGRPVRVIWKIGQREIAFSANISRIAGEITANSGGVDLFAVIDDLGPDTSLRPGAFVSVEIIEEPYNQVATLPETAIDTDDQVFVIDGDRVRPAQVEVVRRLGETILVRGALASGDQVVAKLFDEIGPGAKVNTR